MSTIKCVSCGGTYSTVGPDGLRYYHACPPEILTHATFDGTGKQLTPEARNPRENPRNENVRPGLIYQDGKAHLLVPNLEERAQMDLQVTDSIIIAEGKGSTPVV